MIRYAIAKPEPLRAEHEAFRDAVLGKDADIVTMQQGLATVARRRGRPGVGPDRADRRPALTGPALAHPSTGSRRGGPVVAHHVPSAAPGPTSGLVDGVAWAPEHRGPRRAGGAALRHQPPRGPVRRPSRAGCLPDRGSTATLLTLLWPTTAGSAASKFVARAHGAGRHAEAEAVARHLRRRMVQTTALLAVVAVPVWMLVAGAPDVWGGLCVAALVIGYSGYNFARGLQFGAGQVDAPQVGSGHHDGRPRVRSPGTPRRRWGQTEPRPSSCRWPWPTSSTRRRLALGRRGRASSGGFAGKSTGSSHLAWPGPSPAPASSSCP